MNEPTPTTTAAERVRRFLDARPLDDNGAEAADIARTAVPGSPNTGWALTTADVRAVLDQLDGPCGGCADLDAEAERYRSDLTVAESDLADALALVAKLGERGVDYGPGCGRETCPCRFPGMPCTEWAGDSDSGTWCPRCSWARHHHPAEETR